MNKHFPINAVSDSVTGPGTYPVNKFDEFNKAYGANKMKGSFLSSKREFIDLKYPGPGTYKIEDPAAFG